MKEICRLTEATFTSAEAAVITGISAELQRQWRSRGITRPLLKRVRSLTCLDLAALLILKSVASIRSPLPR